MSKAREAAAKYKDKIYLDDDGVVRWAVDYGNRKKGDRAGKMRKDGFMVIGREQVSLARMVWEMYVGEVPENYKVRCRGSKENHAVNNLFLAGPFKPCRVVGR